MERIEGTLVRGASNRHMVCGGVWGWMNGCGRVDPRRAIHGVIRRYTASNGLRHAVIMTLSPVHGASFNN